MNITGDSRSNYHILREAAQHVKSRSGLSCEIGLRLGMGSKIIMETNPSRHHIAIDPYGNLGYVSAGRTHKGSYSNTMRNECLKNLYDWSYRNKAEFHFFNLEASEFFERFQDGIPIYGNAQKHVINKYAIVHFDGQHDLSHVRKEARFFMTRMTDGGILVFDDIDAYKHDEVEPILLDNNFVVMDKKGTAASYRYEPSD